MIKEEANHLQGDPGNHDRTIRVVKHIAKSLCVTPKILNDEHHRKIFILAILIFAFACFFSILISKNSHRSQEGAIVYRIESSSLHVNSTITPTKWWIKITATVLPAIPNRPTASAELTVRNCYERSASVLQNQSYAYIALTPSLPNRIRPSSSLTSEYLGQIQPGAGVKIVDGPLCSDGYSWWLVESLDKRLRGWTVEGQNSEQWLIPCPKLEVQCSFLPTSTPPGISSQADQIKDKQENTCQSEKLAIDMLAHVNKDDLIVIRAEPAIGAVVGRAGPMSMVEVIEGPVCRGNKIWWKVNALNLDLTGWTTENYLEPCSKDNQCNNIEP